MITPGMEPVVNYYLDSAISDKKLREIAGSGDIQLKGEIERILKTKKRQIYLFLTFNKQRQKAYTGLRVTQYCWDKSKQEYHTARYKESSPKRLNEDLISIKKSVIDAALDNKSAINKEIIKDVINEVRDLKPASRAFTFYNAFEEFIAKSKNRERTSSRGSYIAKTTIKKYEGTLAHLKRFAKAKDMSITFENCNGQLFGKLNAYFVHDLGLADNTISKYLKTLVTFLHYCEDMDFIEPRKIPTVLKEKTGTVVSLSVSELFKLYNHDFKNSRLEKVRDLFCFQCFTGMAYADLANFKKSRIKDGCIYYQRVKKKDSPEVIVPITDWTQSILDKYEELPHRRNV